MRLTLTPVALKNAFATAGAKGGTPGSPMPPIFSVLFDYVDLDFGHLTHPEDVIVIKIS